MSLIDYSSPDVRLNTGNDCFEAETRCRVIRSKLADACVLGLREDLN